MSYFTAAVIKEKSRLDAMPVKAALTKYQGDVQELLIHASYHALKGNSDPINAILEEVTNLGIGHVKKLTLWAEINLPIVVREEKFKLTKDWVKSEVKSEEEFAKQADGELRKAVAWFNMASEPKAKSMWDADTYLNSVINNLTKHGRTDLANEVLAVKAKIGGETV